MTSTTHLSTELRDYRRNAHGEIGHAGRRRRMSLVASRCWFAADPPTTGSVFTSVACSIRLETDEPVRRHPHLSSRLLHLAPSIWATLGVPDIGLAPFSSTLAYGLRVSS